MADEKRVMTPVMIVRSEEAWTTVELADGMVIRAKIVIAGVARIEGETDPFGGPAYAINSQTIISPAMPNVRKTAN